MWQGPESTTQSSDQAINRIKAVNKLVYQPIRRFTKCLWHSQGNALGQSEPIGVNLRLVLPITGTMHSSVRISVLTIALWLRLLKKWPSLVYKAYSYQEEM